MADIMSMTLIQEEYDKIKGNLDDINQSIKKYTWSRNDNLNSNKITSLHEENNKFPKKESQHIFNEFDHIVVDNDEAITEDESEDISKPIINSMIVQVNNSIKSRDDFIDTHKNINLIARNKRMFGHLLGTLTQFKKDSDQAKEKSRATLRTEIERKLEDKANQEKQDLLLEKRQLFTQQKQAKNRMKALEIKIEILKLEEAWEEYQNQMKRFVKTQTHPNIFYLPALMNLEMQSKLDTSTNKIEESILERRSIIENELKKLDEPLFFRNLRVNSDKYENDSNQNENMVNNNNTYDLLEDITKKHIQISYNFQDNKLGDQSSIKSTMDEFDNNSNGLFDKNAKDQIPSYNSINYAIFQFKRGLERKIRVLENEKIAVKINKENYYNDKDEKRKHIDVRKSVKKPKDDDKHKRSKKLSILKSEVPIGGTALTIVDSISSQQISKNLNGIVSKNNEHISSYNQTVFKNIFPAYNI